MLPTIGRIVVYKTTEEDRAFMKVKGNIQKELPAIVVATWGDTEDSAINVKVILDGYDTLWKTSIVKGDEPGNWHWPEIKEANKAVEQEK